MSLKSIWMLAEGSETNYPSLSKDLEMDVVIIGGGITGMTAAKQLANAGKKVAVLERHQIGLGTTGHSTGNLYIPIQPFYQTIKRNFDFETAKKIAFSRELAINHIESQVKANKIQCHFNRRPWFAITTNQTHYLDNEFELLSQMQFPVSYTTEVPFDLTFKKAIKFADQARFNPLRYVQGLAESLDKQNVCIFENTPVLKISEKEGCIIKTPNGMIKSESVIIATHTPLGINTTQLLMGPYRSYAVACYLKNVDYPDCHIWDLENETYHLSTHALTQDKPELLILAGSHHKTGQGFDMQTHFAQLKNYLKDRVTIEKIEIEWSAQHYQSADAAPYIGLADKQSKNIYLATGFWADGLTYGTLAGLLISDLIIKKPNELTEIFNSQRFKPLAAGPKFIKENLNVAWQYIKDYVVPATKSFEDLKAGEGRIVSHNNTTCAVSRDHNQNLHMVSATCTHMKCIVRWNSAEQTWDCPCHGSRFTVDGSVIEGPATENLAKVVRDD